MIHIEKDQEILGQTNLRIVTATGDYEDHALIEFYDVANPTLVAGAFQAQYVKYGSLIYGFNDPVELGNAILGVDPESTHTAASYVRMTKELLAQMHEGVLESSSLDQVITDEQQKTEEKIIESEKLIEEDVISEDANVVESIKEETGIIVEEGEGEGTVPQEEELVETPPAENILEIPVPIGKETPPPIDIEEVVPDTTIIESQPVSMLNHKYEKKVV